MLLPSRAASPTLHEADGRDGAFSSPVIVVLFRGQWTNKIHPKEIMRANEVP